MYTLYLDASGDPGWCPPYGKSNTAWYVLGGLVLETNFIEDVEVGVKEILDEYSDLTGHVIPELKYSALIAGNPDYNYNYLEGIQKKNMADDVLSLIQEHRPTLFSVSVNKNEHYRRYTTPHDPNLLAWRFMATRFDKFLISNSDTGFMFMDAEDTRTNRDFGILIEDARRSGIFLSGMHGAYNTGPNSRLDSIIGFDFVNSEKSPGTQLADFCAHIVWRHVERNQGNRFDQIKGLFEPQNGTMRGFKKWP
jgi:hypothetical protein